ncbi:hypothetical protein FQN54_003461 [Arachnomyces sp. PD_36]|nr:hypothetical protein FQN54_003461 [Arachnomyces sp. PD_36]
MGLSKSNRIILLLIIDTAFFLLELSVGYAVHSLALVADSFHMLNDVLSLCVGLWAVKVAHQKTDSKMYTYGWQRAETLGALVNGVFLVALCLSIFLEAIQRLVEPQEVSNPKLVCIVGCFGLLSNILGLVLFHDHGHGHGEHGHSHAHAEPIIEAEEGRGYSEGQYIAVEAGEGATPRSGNGSPRAFVKSDETGSTVAGPQGAGKNWSNEGFHRRSTSGSVSGSRGFGTVDDIYVHPANLRREIIAASRFEEEQSDSEADNAGNGYAQPSERSGLLSDNNTATYTTMEGDQTPLPRKTPDNGLHDNHNHAQPKTEKKAHSHGDLNMRGVFLHVMGDALGNIGVIASALIIWFSTSPWRYYADPGISLVITVIILCSAIPLCKAASRILLQAVPAGMSIDHIVEDIEQLPGVVSCHHFHVWQLSDTKLVASLHIKVDCEIKGEGSERYMFLARQVRRCLHAYGIHSSTIQPEFYPESDAGDGSATPVKPSGNGSSSNNPSRAASVGGGEPATCLLECGEECAAGGQCCPKPAIVP